MDAIQQPGITADAARMADGPNPKGLWGKNGTEDQKLREVHVPVAVKAVFFFLLRFLVSGLIAL